MMSTALIALLAVATSPSPSKSDPPRTDRFALVIGHNEPLPGSAPLPALRYGDDDAVRWSALLAGFGAKVELLATLDAESRRLYGDLTMVKAAPTLVALQAAMERMRTAISASRAAGRKTIFYFVYAGHGDVRDGEGYVTLADGAFFRRDLESQVLSKSGAHINHVVVDACRSFYFVYDRGPGGTRKPWEGRYFVSGAAARHPNTGFLLSSSSGRPSHEWEEFQAGIFSHEVRSGLFGPADADSDGRITYQEIAAFVRVANKPVRNDRYRPTFVATPPVQGDGVLLDLGGAVGGAVKIHPGVERHRMLEDRLGIRWADLHPGANQTVTLRLPTAPWVSEQLFLRSADGREEHHVPAGAEVAFRDLPSHASSSLRRGAVDEAFAQLFAEPFNQAALALTEAPEGLEESADEIVKPRGMRWAGLSLVGTGLAAAAGAGWLLWSASDLRAEGKAATTTGQRRLEINDTINRRNVWGAVLGAAGVGLSVAGGFLLIKDARSPAAFSLVPLPDGALLSWQTAR